MTLPVPWGNVLGLARSVVAFAIAATLALTPTDVLFTPLLGLDAGPHCSGASGLSLFCVAGAQHLEVSRWLVTAVLLVTASGVLPAVTAIPAAWCALSVAVSISIPDGGDQVAGIVLTLLAAAGVTDPRLHHWQAPDGALDRHARGPWATGTAVVSVWATRIQVSVIYLFACIGKLGNPEWTNGSAIYYWFRHVSFGVPDWVAAPALAATSLPVITLAITWGTLVFEFSMAISLLLPARVRVRILLPVALIFHGGIALLMGITSFSLTMIGAALVLLVPIGESWLLSDRPGEASRSRRRADGVTVDQEDNACDAPMAGAAAREEQVTS